MNPFTDPSKMVIPLSFSTQRLLLRCPQPGDGVEFYAAVQESRAELHLWFDISDEESLIGCETRMRDAQNNFLSHEAFEFLVFMLGSEKLVGRVGLSAANWDTPSFEMGYWIRTPYSGKGLMTEAVMGLTRFAMQVLRANRVAIFCNEQNVKSSAVARRAGYRFEGTLHNDRRHFRTHELVNACVFSFTPEMET